MDIAEIVNAVLTEQRGMSYVPYIDMRSIYDRVCVEKGGTAPLVTAVRVDVGTAIQFSEYARFYVILQRTNGPILRQDLSFVDHLDFFDTVGERHSLLDFLSKEIKQNPWPLLLVFFATLLGSILLGGADGMLSLFTTISPTIAIFVSAFVVFSAARGIDGDEGIHHFGNGQLHKYYEVDLNITYVAILAIGFSLFGTLVAKATHVANVPFVVNGRDMSFDAVQVLASLVLGITMLMLTILFLSLPQYYLKQARAFQFGNLLDAFLAERHDAAHVDHASLEIVPPEK